MAKVVWKGEILVGNEEWNKVVMVVREEEGRLEGCGCDGRGKRFRLMLSSVGCICC